MNVDILFRSQRILMVLLLMVGWTDGHARSDAELLAEYRLEMATVRKVGAAADNLAALVRAGALAEQDADGDEDETTMADIARRYRENPATRQAIEKAGLSVDEFVLCLMSLLQSAMTVAMIQYLPEADREAAIVRSGVAPGNIRFYQANRSVLEDIGRRLQQVAR